MKFHKVLLDGIERALSAIFLEKRHADKVVDGTLRVQTKWGSRDRKFFAETVYDLVRNFRRDSLRALGKDPCEVELMPADLQTIVYLYMQDRFGHPPEGPKIEIKTKELTRAQELSFPDWLWEKCDLACGEVQWAAMAPALSQQAPVFLRTNTLKTERNSLQPMLHAREVVADYVKGAPDALQLKVRKNVFQLLEFKEGLYEVQDAGSQMIAPFLKVKPGDRVIDACAGAGGKSLHLAALMKNKGLIICMDIHEWKLAELKIRARRAGAHIIETRLIENSKVIKRLTDSADAVLLDVPCTGLGVLRRNPDTKWKLTSEKLAELTETQKMILQSYSRMVKPGGFLVYATCSILPDENQLQVKAFLDLSDEWDLEEEKNLVPGENDFDGFYMARLRRKLKH